MTLYLIRPTQAYIVHAVNSYVVITDGQIGILTVCQLNDVVIIYHKFHYWMSNVFHNICPSSFPDNHIYKTRTHIICQYFGQLLLI